MSKNTLPAESDAVSKRPLYHASYLATILCEDQDSVLADNEGGGFNQEVDLWVDDPDLIWMTKAEDPDNPFVPTASGTTFRMRANKEPKGAGLYEKYALTNGQDSMLSGLSAYLVCNREPTGWQSRSPRGPWTKTATLFITHTQRTQDQHREMFSSGAAQRRGAVVGEGSEIWWGKKVQDFLPKA